MFPAAAGLYLQIVQSGWQWRLQPTDYVRVWRVYSPSPDPVAVISEPAIVQMVTHYLAHAQLTAGLLVGGIFPGTVQLEQLEFRKAPQPLPASRPALAATLPRLRSVGARRLRGYKC